jgi:hypothetical protein
MVAQDLIDVERPPCRRLRLVARMSQRSALRCSASSSRRRGIVEQERFAATVLVNSEQVRAGGQQLGAQTEKVGKDLENVGDVKADRARQDRWQLFALPVPEQVVDNDVVAGTGRGEMHDRDVVLLQPDQHAFRVEAPIAATRCHETVSGHGHSLSPYADQVPARASSESEFATYWPGLTTLAQSNRRVVRGVREQGPGVISGTSVTLAVF